MRGRVLVVDDNLDMVETMTTLLRLERYDAKGCVFATEAMHYVREFDPHVVLLDIRMPGRSGWDIAEEIHRAFPRKRPMLIGISGERLTGGQERLPEAKGLDYFLLKPIDTKALFALIAKAMVPDC